MFSQKSDLVTCSVRNLKLDPWLQIQVVVGIGFLLLAITFLLYGIGGQLVCLGHAYICEAHTCNITMECLTCNFVLVRRFGIFSSRENQTSLVQEDKPSLWTPLGCFVYVTMRT